MENLRTQLILLKWEGKEDEFQVEEKDHGDMVVYDIFRKDQYLLTIACDGSILFMNFDAPEREKEVFKLSVLHALIDAIRAEA